MLPKNSLNIINPEKIMFCRTHGRKTEILLIDGIGFILNIKLYKLERELVNMDFFRCHNSFIVNINYVEQVENTKCKLKDSNEIILVSRRKKAELKKKLKGKHPFVA
jgi:DNA-binding LytR/AlgR family response regulator